MCEFARHIQFLNFSALGFIMPVYINVFCEPAERRKSHYYFRNYYLETIIIILETILQKTWHSTNAYKEKWKNCTVRFNYLAYFCGHRQNCANANTALQITKQNAVQYYKVIGLTEDLELFFQLCEYFYPAMFAEAVEIYRKTTPKRVDSDRSLHQMQSSTREIMRHVLAQEYDFYGFVKQHLHKAKKKAGTPSKRTLVWLSVHLSACIEQKLFSFRC